mgnify:CR=1 FL=1
MLRSPAVMRVRMGPGFRRVLQGFRCVGSLPGFCAISLVPLRAAVNGSTLTTFAPIVAGPTTDYTKYYRESAVGKGVFDATAGTTAYTFTYQLSSLATYIETTCATCSYSLQIRVTQPDGTVLNINNPLNLGDQIGLSTLASDEGLVDGGLKIAQDALCQGLGLNDNRIIETHLYKEVDKAHPRMEGRQMLMVLAPK